MTKHDFFKKLATLEAAAPQHPLLPMLRRGHSAINEIYLQNALKKVDAAVMGGQHSPKMSGISENDGFPDSVNEHDLPDDDPADERLRLMRVELRGLFSERAKLSDRFHELTTIEARAENSEEIQIVQLNIGRQMKKIRTWKLTNTLPDDESAKFYVPKDGLALARAQNSLRVRISRKNKEVEVLRKNAETNNAAERALETQLDKLKKLKNELAQVDKAIADLKK